MPETKRKGGVQTAEAKAKAGKKMRGHKKIRQTKPEWCETCTLLKPVDHRLVEGVRTWMCRACLCADNKGYIDSEVERVTRSGSSSLA